MKALKFACVLPALIAASAAFTSSAHAVTYTPQVITSGSSAQFGVFAEAAYQLAKADGQPFHYTAKSSACSPACTTLVDSRNTNILAEAGNMWIVWSATSGRVWMYTGVDSTVGVRVFEASPRAKVTLDPQGTGTADLPAAGSNALSVWDDGSKDTALPSAVYSVLNGAKVNAANTDIRPEDALYATTRTLTSIANGGLGYGNYVSGNCQVGVGYKSEITTTGGAVATPVSFVLSGTDPCSAATVPATTTIPVGVAPIVFIANTLDTASGGLGTTAVSNLTSTGSNNAYTLFSGTTCDAGLLGGGSSTPVFPILREPLSGTMNTTEYSVFEPTGTQEKGVNSTSGIYNPLDAPCSAGGGTRYRAIGTGDVTKGVNADKDSLGYVFFSYEALSPTALPNVKYLKYNGYDPLATSATSTYTGALPACVNSGGLTQCPLASPKSSFFELRAGNYTAWSLYRMVTDSSGANNTAVKALIAKAQVVVDTTLPDFVPFNAVCGSSSSKDDPGSTVYREHYTTSGVTANDGSLPANVTCTTGGSRTIKASAVGGGVEAGGDVGGTIVHTATAPPATPYPTQANRP